MSKPAKHYRPTVARRSHTTRQQAMGTCPECGKRAYTSKGAAKNAARLLYPGRRMRFYKCGTWWHLTSQGAGRSAGWREWLAGPGEGA